MIKVVPTGPLAPYHDREAWLLARQGGIGSSEVWKLFDEEMRAELYLDKTGDVVDDQEVTADMERGRVYEDIAAERYELLTGRKTRRLPMRVHPDYPWLLTDIDRQILANTGEGQRQDGSPYLVTETGALEIKCPRWHVISRYKGHGLPDRIIWQVQQHMLVTGYPYCAFAAYDAVGLSILEWDIEADLGMQERILEEAERFWHDHVLERVPPQSDEVPVAGVAIPQIEGEYIIHEDEEWAEAAELFKEVKPMKTETEAAYRAVSARLKKLAAGRYGRHEGAGVSATLTLVDGRVNWKATVDAIDDALPLDKELLKKLLVDEEFIHWVVEQHSKGMTLSDGTIQNLINSLTLDVRKFTVRSDPSDTFTPRLMRQE